MKLNIINYTLDETFQNMFEIELLNNITHPTHYNLPYIVRRAVTAELAIEISWQLTYELNNKGRIFGSFGERWELF